VCSRLALFHEKKWTPEELKLVKTTLDNTPVFRERLKAMARQEADLVLTAHRMMLEDKVSNKK
jgi:hypothetical protein